MAPSPEHSPGMADHLLDCCLHNVMSEHMLAVQYVSWSRVEWSKLVLAPVQRSVNAAVDSSGCSAVSMPQWTVGNLVCFTSRGVQITIGVSASSKCGASTSISKLPYTSLSAHQLSIAVLSPFAVWGAAKAGGGSCNHNADVICYT